MAPARKRQPESEPDGLAARAVPVEHAVEQAAQRFDLLSEPTRLRILLLLDQAGEMNSAELHQALALSQPAVGTDLKKLRLGRLVESRRAGTSLHYRLASSDVHDFVRLARRLVEASQGRGEH